MTAMRRKQALQVCVIGAEQTRGFDELGTKATRKKCTRASYIQQWFGGARHHA